MMFRNVKTFVFLCFPSKIAATYLTSFLYSSSLSKGCFLCWTVGNIKVALYSTRLNLQLFTRKKILFFHLPAIILVFVFLYASAFSLFPSLSLPSFLPTHSFHFFIDLCTSRKVIFQRDWFFFFSNSEKF